MDTKPIDSEMAAKFVESWMWTRRLQQDGECVVISRLPYPKVMIRGSMYAAHRLVLVAKLGRDIEPSMVADHTCDNPRCVNPDHLRETSQRDNVMRSEYHRSRSGSATHCPHGHEYTPENQYTSSRGRNCKTCIKQRAMDRYYAGRVSEM